MTETEKEIARQYELWTGKEPEILYLLPASGSARKYYRITAAGRARHGQLLEEWRCLRDGLTALGIE